MDVEALRIAAKNIAKGTQNNTTRRLFLPESLIRVVPSEEQIRGLLRSFERQQEPERGAELFHQNILVLELIFRDTRGFQSFLRSIIDETVRFRNYLARSLLPTDSFAEQSPFTKEQFVPSQSKERLHLRAAYSAGLRLLLHIRKLEGDSSHDLPTELITCLASFTRAEDPWANETSLFEASCLLDGHIQSLKLDNYQNLLTRLLREEIKPAFAKSKNSAVTPAGRKAITALLPRLEASIDEIVLKPWKYSQVHIVTVFEWIMRQLDARSIESNWPLLIPPLLALLDDASTAYKIRGCSLLTTLLRTVPPQLLERTGLGEVFHEALTPCLLYLPALTPEAESLQLLNAVYPTLLALIRTRFPLAKDHGSKQEALDQILRYGILKGYAHAGENVRIAEFLVTRMTDLVTEMGIASCKYLKDILPLLSGILLHPFATAYPPLLIAGLHAAESVMINDWPRISYYRSEILKGLVGCWCKILEDDTELSPSLDQVQTEIKYTVRLLTAVLKQDVDVTAEYHELIASDGRLEELLAT